jgi:hypothetical protein
VCCIRIVSPSKQRDSQVNYVKEEIRELHVCRSTSHCSLRLFFPGRPKLKAVQLTSRAHTGAALNRYNAKHRLFPFRRQGTCWRSERRMVLSLKLKSRATHAERWPSMELDRRGSARSLDSVVERDPLAKAIDEHRKCRNPRPSRGLDQLRSRSSLPSGGSRTAHRRLRPTPCRLFEFTAQSNWYDSARGRGHDRTGLRPAADCEPAACRLVFEMCRVVVVKSAYQSRFCSGFVRPETGVRFGRKELHS